MKILSSFTRHQVYPNLYECLCSAEHKDILKNVGFFFSTVEVNGASKQPGYKLSSEYLPCAPCVQNKDMMTEFSLLGELSL